MAAAGGSGKAWRKAASQQHQSENISVACSSSIKRAYQAAWPAMLSIWQQRNGVTEINGMA